MYKSKTQVAILQKELQKKKTEYWRERTGELKIDNLNLDLVKEVGELIDKFEYKLRQKWAPETRELFENNFKKFKKSICYDYGEIIDAIVDNLNPVKIEKIKEGFIKKFENFYKDETEKVEKDYIKRLKEQEKKLEEEERKLWRYIKKRWSKRELKKMFKEYHSRSFEKILEKLGS